MLYVNIISSYREVVAICDSELLGKVFEQGQFQLNIKENFYKGEEMTREQTLNLVKNMAQEDATFNIVGRHATQICIEVGILSEDTIKEIHGVPYALILM